MSQRIVSLAVFSTRALGLLVCSMLTQYTTYSFHYLYNLHTNAEIIKSLLSEVDKGFS